MPLRTYQTEAIRSIQNEFAHGVSRQLVVMATGLGKTVVAAHVPHFMPKRKRGMFIVHRNELCLQAQRQFEKHNPELKVGVERAEYRAGDADIVIASVQTIGKMSGDGKPGDRLKQFRPDDFSWVICDEVHHGTSDTYRAIFRHMRVLKGEPGCNDFKLFCGITATPNRSDSIGLECLFDKITVINDVRFGVREGWLSRIHCNVVETEIDLSHVHTTAGDFNAAELSATVDTPTRNELIAQEYLKNRPDGPSFFFVVDINHAHNLSEVLRGNGIHAYAISGKTPEDECRRFMKMINEGSIDGLASAGKLNEGVDAPRVCAAWMCRPTKSQLLYQQMVGRVLRPFPSPEDLQALSNVGQAPAWVKPFASITDFVDICGRHSLCTTPTLFSLRHKFDAKRKDIIEAVEEIEALEAEHPGLDLRSAPNLDAIKTSLHRLDLLASPSIPEEIRKISRFVWTKESPGAYHLGVLDGSLISVRENTLGDYEIYRHIRGIRTKLWVAKSLKEAVSKAEDEIPNRDQKVMMADASWRREPCTEKQAARLLMLDHKLRTEFHNPVALFAFCVSRYNSGDGSFSRGSISNRISSLTTARS